MNLVKWAKYKSWSGCNISAGTKWILTDEQKEDHMHRAMYLTSMLETYGKFGPVNSYDGAGISAGLEHNIAIFPKYMKQGPLWKQLREIELFAPCENYSKLSSALKGENKYIDQNGTLRNFTNGSIISAIEIRNMVAPPSGKVPKKGPAWEQAKLWAILFHNLFMDDATFKVQIGSAIRSLIYSNRKEEIAAYEATVGISHPTALRAKSSILPDFDLAWCVYHSFSVNAPGKARRVLAATSPDNSSKWPKRLIRAFGSTKYGRWHDQITNGNRYDRTRISAKNSGLWPENLFIGNSAIMPRNL